MKPTLKKLKAKPSRLGRKGASSCTPEMFEELEERLAKLEAALKKQETPEPQPEPTTYIPPYNFQKEPLF
jgi:hypothetical protein